MILRADTAENVLRAAPGAIIFHMPWGSGSPGKKEGRSEKSGATAKKARGMETLFGMEKPQAQKACGKKNYGLGLV